MWVGHGQPPAFDGVQLDATGDLYHYLRSYDVQVSANGVNYTSVASGTATGANEVIRFAPQTARYLRVLPLEGNPSTWSIGEINVCAQSAPLPIAVNGPTVTVTGTSPIQLEYLAFSGTVGQVLHLSTLSAPSNVNQLIRIYRPNGELLGEREMSNSYPALNDYSGDWFMDPLPETGTYLIRVEYYDSANTYAFSLTADQGSTATPTPTSTPTHTPTPTASGTETVIYGDALASDWLNWSNSGTFNLANAAPVQTGNASVAVSFTSAWDGSLTFKTFSNPVTNYESLRFWAHGGASGASFTFYAQNSSGTNSPFIDLSAPANVWTEFVITKAQLNNLSNLARLDWSANGSSTSSTFFVDHVRAVMLGGPTVTPTPTSPATSTPTPTPTASGTETMIYGDALASGWLNWSSSGTFNLANTSPVQSGNASVAVSFTGAWDGSLTFKTFSSPVTNYDSLRFWVHGGASGASFTFYAQNSSGTSSPFIDLSAPANVWTEFVITKAQLNTLSDLARLDWSANGSSTSSTFFVDNVRTQ
ncbi:MAG: discoidin domain-containing protein [Anaerolineae bacterium]|nr:discoidin domain-containing protein [Anaerolineae bacterium]